MQSLRHLDPDKVEAELQRLALFHLKPVWFCAGPFRCGCEIHFIVGEERPPNAIVKATPGPYKWSGVVLEEWDA